jgi:periplasmic protein TonB
MSESRHRWTPKPPREGCEIFPALKEKSAMERINVDTTPTPRLPPRAGSRGTLACFAALLLHAALTGGVLLMPRGAPSLMPSLGEYAITTPQAAGVTHMVFIPSTRVTSASGGGGGGNRQTTPIRRASGVGRDAITLRIRKPVSEEKAPSVNGDGLPALPAVVLDAVPLASGAFDQVGLPEGGVAYSESTGPGSRGGVGNGSGTGIGPGRGPGVGTGEGGGTGGGVYRAGGAVTAPRVLTQVQPDYTADAIERRVQGIVILAIVVRRDGCASDIHVIRPLDAGLDEQAVRAVAQWRFAPGRLAGSPVDVAATVVVDFTIR